LSSTEPPTDDVEDSPGVVDDTAGDGEDTTTGVTEGPPIDDARQVVLDALAAELGDALVATETHRDDIWVRVRREAWKPAAEACRSLGFDYFCFLSGLDWMPSQSVMRGEVSSDVDVGDDADEAAAAEVAEDEQAMATDESGREAEAGDTTDGWTTGHAGGDTRFQVFARLYSIERHMGLTLKADLDEDAPSVETWSEVYAGADWHERETWEMFGFDFVGHPHLIHMYLPGEFEGFPLRKDFPLLAREVKPWPGLVDVEPMPETEEEAAAAAVVAGAETDEATAGADAGTEGS